MQQKPDAENVTVLSSERAAQSRQRWTQPLLRGIPAEQAEAGNTFNFNLADGNTLYS